MILIILFFILVAIFSGMGDKGSGSGLSAGEIIGGIFGILWRIFLSVVVGGICMAIPIPILNVVLAIMCVAGVWGGGQ